MLLLLKDCMFNATQGEDGDEGVQVNYCEVNNVLILLLTNSQGATHDQSILSLSSYGQGRKCFC